MSTARRTTRTRTIMAGLGVTLLSACSPPDPSPDVEGREAPSATGTHSPAAPAPGATPSGWEAVPDGYSTPAEQRGSLVELTYTTTHTVAQDGAQDKDALVYLPPGYDPDDDVTRYPVLYLMHGLGGDQYSWTGRPDRPTPLPSIFDHAITDGRIDPVIVVTPTYDPSPDSFGTAVAAFHQELVEDLVPAVESTYPTFAETVDADGLRASREHRAFGGFSMGGVTTWYLLEHAPDVFAGFLPMAGDSWNVVMFGGLERPEETAASLARGITGAGYGTEDLDVLAATGSGDFTTPNMEAQIPAMAEHPEAFDRTDDGFEDGNLVYHVVPGNAHDYPWGYEYVYNGLRMLPALRD
ncbi:alpha/beta hydrolase-fold protein [Isoptericola sp. AK164]|uniref:alpha/beta hydrolase n=1 Tax=Isoptericola sp. AK164 TaxID=3024246 RepID=UPI0024189367|nr:alpha/beta hydrolase-fold protein [Isoptericola sp. AK164]